MYLGALIVGIISLTTTFSYAAPSIYLSPNNQDQLLTSQRIPFSNWKEEENHLSNRRHAISGGPPESISDDRNVFGKRKWEGEFWADTARDGWDISITEPSLPNGGKEIGQHFWLGKLTKSPRKLGEGGQGLVIVGEWQEYSEVINNLADAMTCEELKPVAIKVSEGLDGYRSAELLAPIKSRYIVKVMQYAKQRRLVNGKHRVVLGNKGIGPGLPRSIVAFEKLTINADIYLNRGGQTDLVSLLLALIRGSMDAKKHNIFNMDIKLPNLMASGMPNSMGSQSSWNIIDWDMVVDHDTEKPRSGYSGTLGYMPPEMVAYLLDSKTKAQYTAEKAVVWTIGMTFLYSQGIGKYEGTVTEEMRQFAKNIYDDKGIRPMRDDSNEDWAWIALLLALARKKSILDEDSNVLPLVLQKGGKFENFRPWYEKVLCMEKDRYDLDQAWKALFELEILRSPSSSS